MRPIRDPTARAGPFFDALDAAVEVVPLLTLDAAPRRLLG
jgi:hypothetical protein